MSEQRRGGLGRGLAALIPSGPTAGPRLGNAAADVIIGGRYTGGPGGGVATAPADVATVDGTFSSDAVSSDAVSSDTALSGSSRPESHQADSHPPGNPEPGADPDAPAIYRELAIADIMPNPRQPRTVFEEEALAELVHSIREFGLMQPIVVRESMPGRYEIVMGERRWRAMQAAGLPTIPAIIRRTADAEMLRNALLENIHRAQLNPLEEAAAYSQLLEEFDVTHDELAARLGRSRPVVSNTIRLLRLPVGVQRRVAAGVLSAGHARALLSLDGADAAQEALAARIVAEGLSVRATEEAVVLRHAEDGEQPSAPAPRRRPIQMPGLQDVADTLSDSFDTRVTVSLGRRKGKIVVEFGSVDDLERIVGLMRASAG